MNDLTEVEQFFGSAVVWYRAQGLLATRPEHIQVEPLDPQLVSADVFWAALDASGAARSTEHSRYLLSLAEDDTPRIRVAISLAS